ncbi:hypothetical protein N9R88_00645 [Candidatus Pelagibacter sp.]|nr:hypothetical protein [Candidatus Pelagibacter sp.]
MWKKIFIQISLLLLAIFLVFYTYKIYFKSDVNIETNIINDPQEDKGIRSNNEQAKKVEDNSNLIKSLKYVSKDILGNEYIINSEYSEINLENTNMINMTDVDAKIIMFNKEPIFITSKYAKYNNITYETTFFDNVKIDFLDNTINSEKFTISVANNFAEVSQNVVYQNKEVKLEADTIEIDLITKNSKIFMTDENKKIKIINK